MYPYNNKLSGRPSRKHARKGAKPKGKRTKTKSRHLDYDLTPLEVDGLGHYIEPVAGPGRFLVH